MSIVHCRWALAIFAAAGGVSYAQQIILPSDVGVTLSATPTSDLAPGEPIDMTLTVTNYGPAPITNLELTSSDFVDELQFVSEDLQECYLALVVVDTITGSFYYYTEWLVTGLPGQPPFIAGETLICHFQIALTAQASPVLPFSFGLPNFIGDSNPSNDRAAVSLQRVGAPAGGAAPVPALSPAMLLLLAGLLATAVGITGRRRRSGRS